MRVRGSVSCSTLAHLLDGARAPHAQGSRSRRTCVHQTHELVEVEVERLCRRALRFLAHEIGLGRVVRSVQLLGSVRPLSVRLQRSQPQRVFAASRQHMYTRSVRCSVFGVFLGAQALLLLYNSVFFRLAEPGFAR